MYFLRLVGIFVFSLTTFKNVSGQELLTLPTGVLPGSFGGNQGPSDLATTIEGFSYSLNFDSNYQSNINLESSGGEGAFSLLAGANLSYRTAGDADALLVGVFTYSPAYQQFFSSIDTPGNFQQAGSASLVYSGNLLSANLGLNFSSGGGSNRLAGGFVESSQTSINGGVSWNYSPKTSFGLSASYVNNDFGENILNGSETASFGANASWQATPLINIGPYLSLSRTTSDFAGSLDALGFGINVNYELSGKTSLSGTLGVQNQTFERGGGGAAFVGSLNANWQPDGFYQVDVSFVTNTIAAPLSLGEFVNNYDFNLRVSRPLGEGGLSFGTGFSFSQFEASDAIFSPRDNEKFVSVTTTYTRPIFWEEVNLNTSASYRKGFGGREFTSYILSAGINYSF